MREKGVGPKKRIVGKKTKKGQGMVRNIFV